MAAAFALDGRKADAGISYMRLNPKVAETSVLNADASALIGRLGVSVRYRSFREEPVSFTDGDGALTGSFRPRESLAGIGAEYVFDGTAALRAGGHYGNSILAIQSYASAGLGLFLGKASVDLTILFGSETFEGSLMAGIRYGF